MNKWKKTHRQEILIVCQEKANIEIDKKKKSAIDKNCW